MSNQNFYLQLKQGWQSSADKPFITGPGIDSITYAEGDAATERLSVLFKTMGLAPGDRILTRTAKSPMALMVYLACLRSGLIYVPVNPACTRDELAYFIGDTSPSLFIGDQEHAEFVAAQFSLLTRTLDAQGNGSLTDESQKVQLTDEQDILIHESQADDIAVLIYTSGTTGAPKGAMLSHGNLAANASVLYESWGWSGDDVLLHCLPIFHVHGLFVATHLAMLGGSTLIFLPGFNAPTVLDLLPKATVFMGVPTYYTRLLQVAGLDQNACAGMRLFVSGSAPLLEETFHAFQQRTGHTILERYGMSETGMLVSNPLKGERLAGTVGYALDGVQTRICDEQGQEVTRGDIGVLQVKGPNVFSGYWGKPELNASEFQDGYFITGDLVSQQPDGRLAIVGRNKDMIISGGLNVYPKEIETILDTQPGVQESAVFGIPHPDFGEGVVAAVVPASGSTVDTDTLLATAREHLAGYKLPKSIVLVDTLPRNTMGKVQKNRLREQFGQLFQP